VLTVGGTWGAWGGDKGVLFLITVFHNSPVWVHKQVIILLLLFPVILVILILILIPSSTSSRTIFPLLLSLLRGGPKEKDISQFFSN